MGRFEDITGQKFGRLTAINYAGDRKWLFKCDCGKEKIIRTNDVKSGRTQSCGCYGREKINEACTTHNMSKTRLYSVYASMKQRCFNEKVSEYKQAHSSNPTCLTEINNRSFITVSHDSTIKSWDVIFAY